MKILHAIIIFAILPIVFFLTALFGMFIFDSMVAKSVCLLVMIIIGIYLKTSNDN